MVLGKLADTNLFAAGAASGGTWSAALPLANLLVDADYVGSPARCEDATSLAKSQFQVVLDDVYPLSMVVLLFHTMSLGAKYRITVSSLADAAYAAPALQTDWEYVYPSIYDPLDLDGGDPNAITGTLTEAELGLYPPHMWAPFAEVLGQRVRVEIDDRNHPAGWFDIGCAWGVSGWSPAINFERGRQLSVQARDLVDEAASGRLFSEERTPRRQLALDYAMLSNDEAWRWVDAALRARTTRTVLFAPDTDDFAALVREGFPAVFGQLPGARLTYPGLNSSSVALKEILA